MITDWLGEKESCRWLQTYEDARDISRQLPGVHIVCIGDGESDIFELFDQRRCRGGAVDILVRAKHNRCLLDQEKKLFEHMAQHYCPSVSDTRFHK